MLERIFGEPVSTGRSFMTAGLILAIMIVPIITSISREVLATVPQADKHAAFALGATQWEMITGAVFPHSFGGMVGAVMLGLGRAMGETIAVSLVIGGATRLTPNVFAGGNALPAVIVQNFGESTGTFTAALIGLRRRAVRDDGRRQPGRAAGRAPRRDPNAGSGDMTTTVPPAERADAAPPSLRRSALAPRRRIIDRVALVAITLALVAAVVPLAWVTIYVLAQGLPEYELATSLPQDIPNS